MTPDQLRSQLGGLVDRGYRGATFADVARGEITGRTLVVTFDDAFHSVLEHAAPAMSELGIPGTIFVPTRFPGTGGPLVWAGIDHWLGGEHDRELRSLDWDELRSLAAAGWEIGSHTVSHPSLPELGDAALASELADSKAEIEAELGAACLTLAYPYGDHDSRVERAAESVGYIAAATTRPGPPARFRWGRVGVHPIDTPRRFAIKSSTLVNRIRSSRAGSYLERRAR